MKQLSKKVVVGKGRNKKQTSVKGKKTRTSLKKTVNFPTSVWTWKANKMKGSPFN